MPWRYVMRPTYFLKTCPAKRNQLRSSESALFTVFLCILRYCSCTFNVDKEPVVHAKSSPLPFSCYLIPHGHKWSKDVWVLEAKKWNEAVRSFVHRLLGGKISKLCLFFEAVCRWGSVVCSFFLWLCSHILRQTLPLGLGMYFLDSWDLQLGGSSCVDHRYRAFVFVVWRWGLWSTLLILEPLGLK